MSNEQINSMVYPQFLDNEQNVTIRKGGNLPHWHQRGKMQYITFRLHDSLPQTRIEELKRLESCFVQSHPQPWNRETHNLYWQNIGKLKEKWVDCGFGSCILRIPDIRQIVSQAIWFKNKIDYQLIAYVIMPNHVHIILQPREDIEIGRIIGSIKGYTSMKINKMLSRTGPLWMHESFDRIVRSHDDLKRIRNYIANNPRHLPASDYELYV